MNYEAIFTLIGVGVSIIGANVVLISWIRSDMKVFETETRSLIREIQKEMNDFHTRLCVIDEKNKDK